VELLPAPEEEEVDATSTYAVFRNEITASGDPLKDIPAADFFSLDVLASVEAEPGSPQTPSPASAVAATPASSRAAEEQPAQGSERAWFRGGRRFRSPILQLHKGDNFIGAGQWISVASLANLLVFRTNPWPHGVKGSD
jgi:non-canonical poly(A) RNA polymerase PAPD5/7